MRTWKILPFIITIGLSFTACRGPEGPIGPEGPAGQGTGSLGDPSIMPKVIYTYPPQNSIGPYEEFYVLLGWIRVGYPDPGYLYPIYFSQFQLRFNKFMDVSSLRHAISITSPLNDVVVDTNNVLSVGGDVFFVNPVDTNGNRIARWHIGQNYTFKVSASAHDINSNSLQQPFSMTFMPEPYFRVREISPGNGATGISSSNIDITVMFNSLVDTSILSYVQLSPRPFGNWSISYDSTSIYFYSNQTLDNSTTYTTTIGSGAHDKYGNQLPQPFVSTFTTAPFEITSTYPTDGSQNIGIGTTIDIEFSAPIDTATARAAFSIRPSGNGTMTFYISSINFAPSQEFLLDTMYSVEVDSTIRSQKGLKLSAPSVFSFRTAPFTATSYPWDGYTNFSRTGSIQINCNALIDTGSVRSSFSLLDSMNVRVAGNFTLFSNGFYFYPSIPLDGNALYRISVSTGLTALQGKHLKSPVSSYFMTGEY